MATVFVHLHNEGESIWINQNHDFERIPVENEYITIDCDSEWYKVELVVHTPFCDEMSAEIFAVRVDHNKEMKKKVKNQSSTMRVLK